MNGNDLTPIPEFRSDVYPPKAHEVCAYHSGLTNKITEMDTRLNIHIASAKENSNMLRNHLGKLNDSLIKLDAAQQVYISKIAPLTKKVEETTNSLEKFESKMNAHILKTTGLITGGAGVIVLLVKYILSSY